MGKPKHQRCTVCNVVIARYSHTSWQGPFSISVWVRDADNGSNQGADGRSYCDEHAEVGRSAKPPHVPTEPIEDELLRRAANDSELTDGAFTVLSRALRGADPAGGEQD